MLDRILESFVSSVPCTASHGGLLAGPSDALQEGIMHVEESLNPQAFYSDQGQLTILDMNVCLILYYTGLYIVWNNQHIL